MLVFARIVPAGNAPHCLRAHIANGGSQDGHLFSGLDFPIDSTINSVVKISIGENMFYDYVFYLLVWNALFAFAFYFGGELVAAKGARVIDARVLCETFRAHLVCAFEGHASAVFHAFHA